MLRPVLLLLAALSGLLACAPLGARAPVEIAIVDRDTGEWLPEYRQRGRAWIEGRPGHRYAVRLTNRTDRRVLVVLSVDGVNAVTGQTAHPSQAGYVLGPWQSTEVAGWRKSYDEIAQFVFTDLPDSYAARTGRPDDVGVIGIAVFEEREYPRYEDAPAPIAREESARGRTEAKASAPSAAREAAADSAYGGIAQQRIGTGHGAREWSPTRHTGFVRASRTPAQVTQLRYDDPDALAARGILPRPERWWSRHDEPTAFPDGFVADPPRW